MLDISPDDVFNACSSKRFVSGVLSKGPFRDVPSLLTASRRAWWHEARVTDWLEAFTAHPRIGDIDSLKSKYTEFAKSSQSEQAAASSASGEVLQALKQYNEQYEAKFGHIFIVCASGKSAAEMLCLVRDRLNNPPHTELLAAAKEQMKITELRLQKIVSRQAAQTKAQDQTAELADRRAGSAEHLQSPITTHVLDTSMGSPAQGVQISLHRESEGSSGVYDCIAQGKTNRDGRIPDLLPPSTNVLPGKYRITFNTTDYMRACKHQHPDFFPNVPFYPQVDVHFNISESQTSQHFHVPLTWNPYGYSTYRGS